ncbi:phage tail tape measure protein [Rhodobacteraceae bacterium 2CG4]|uniref:Phage tail tape measure protein n=1 Tax=Halovulum marinum TaxID=2662447 RepID=A0A6L5YXT3_9RHOB|nr:phage tail tape measure protein [Halovulum marinum]MSU89008.1 phage tail tape measure protein [Halovulum marinum]
MADLENDLARLEGTIQGLESSISGAESMTTAFRSEMEDVTSSMRTASRDASTLSRSLGTSLKRAMDDLILDGAKLSSVLGGVGRSMAGSVLSTAVKPVQDALGGAVVTGLNGLLGGVFANGSAFSSGRVRAFAKGGVVDGPTTFPMRGGTGLMGEAGPEAIMPLSRGPDGRLGVRTQGGGRPVQVTMNISTPDADSFRRSRTQIAAQLSRALGQGRRNQ